MARCSLKNIAKRLCEAYPNSSKLSIARRLMKETGCTMSTARSAIARATGAAGESQRHFKTVESRFNEAPTMPVSRALKWVPFDVVGDLETLILSDVHAPYHSELALGAAVGYGRKRKPDIILLNGDFGDWYRCSRYTQDPSSRYPFLLDELDQQKKILRWLRKQFPKQRIIFKMGNHDERWDHWIWSRAPELAEMPELRLEHMLDFDSLGIEMVGDKRPIMLGKLPVWHGHELQGGATSPVNPARGVFMKLGTSGLIGHCHRSSSHGESNWKHDELFCWSTGCLCDLNPAFAVTNRWNWGGAYVEQSRSGIYQVTNFRIDKHGEVHQ